MNNCCCKKGFPAVLALFAFRTLVGMAFCGGLFSWVYKLDPVNVWKPMTAPTLSFFVGSFVLCMIFVFVYKMVNPLLGNMSRIKKGFLYGLAVWALGCLPGMWATYSFMTVNTTVVLYWTIMGFVATPIEGIIVAAIIGDGTESCSIKK